jgi:ribosomal protein S12 methylthiotransferase
MEEIIGEVQSLVNKGVKEFQLIAQDLSYYGADRYKSLKLHELVERLSDIQGVEWIRLHYAYPAQFPYNLLKVMRERENVCKYLDIALQHISDKMLKLMRRNFTKQETFDLIETIRNEVPGIHIRTTMLLGHPGETDEDVEELKEFIEKIRFERLGAFAFSNEEGTYAFENYQDIVSEEVKLRRIDEIMAVQQKISAEINQTKIGSKLKVIIDRQEGGNFIGRTEFDSPEVDPEVIISANTPGIEIGNFYQAEIIDADEYDLYAK